MPATWASLEISTLRVSTCCSYGVLIWRNAATSGAVSRNDTPRKRSRACRANSRSAPRGSSPAGTGGSRSPIFARPAATAPKNVAYSVSSFAARRDPGSNGASSNVSERNVSNCGVG
jgi:hypothetical protein